MKKIIFSFLIGSVLISSTGCLKDKNYEDQKYGIQNTEVKGIGFVQNAYVSPISADAVPQTLPDLNVGLNTNEISTVDIKYSVALDFAVVPDSLNGIDITNLPAGSFTFTANSVIPAGKTFGNFPVIVTNASLLDPNKTYGVGFKIVSVDPGYTIAQNSRTFYVTINIKNKYDGRYKLNGLHNRPPYNQFPYTDVTMDMYTSGPSSVRFYIPLSGFNSYGHPIGVAPGVIGWYGPTVSPNVTFDPVSNLVTNVNNADPAGPPISIYSGVLSGVGRYDAATKKMYVYFRYNANDLRGFTDTLTYTGPRP